MNIYVGNLPLEVTENEIRQLFVIFGEVVSVIIMNDKYIGSGQPRGYGFVKMPSVSEGKTAIAALNGKSFRHMVINVIEALPLSDSRCDGSYSCGRGSKFRSRMRQRRY